MELVKELVFTALIAMLFSYLVAKLVSFAMAGGGDDSGSGSDVIMEELQFGEKMNVGILESQNRVEFVEQEETVEKVDKFEADTVSAISKDVVVEQSEEINEEGKESKDDLVSYDDDDDDDDWEGIERSELENVFAKAVKIVEESGNENDLLSDVQMELYALHKIATEGPCHEPQPMTLMLSARSKRNAWLKLGNMNPEEAMEQYVALLSDRVPGWMKESYCADDKLESEEIGKPDDVGPLDMSSFKGNQTDSTHERNLELKFGSEGVDLTGISSSETGAKE